MTSKPKVFLFVALLFFLGCFGVEIEGYCQSQEDVPSKILVRFRQGTGGPVRKGQALAIPGVKFVRSIRRFNVDVLEVQGVADKQILIDLVQNLRKNAAIEWAEPNFRRYPNRTPNDPQFSDQWHLNNTGQTGGTAGADISAPQAWDITSGTQSVVVAILDTGVEYTHPDLEGNMWRNLGEDWNGDGSPGRNGIDDDHNGYVDDYYGADIANGTGDPLDTYGHGTHVAGIIGAVGNNNIGVCGVAWDVSLMAVKFLDPDGSVADEIEGISYILDQKEKGVPICAVNMSFGGSEYSRFEEEALQSLQDAGIMVAAAAGNEGGELGGYRSNYPSSYSLTNIISVAATDDTDELASFSNYGFYYVDVAAPGQDILSCYLDASYDRLSGTSMATPVVTGTLALIYSMGNRTVSEARERIIRGVDKLEGLSGGIFSEGRVNAARALSLELAGPFIFGIDPVNGDPGTEVNITGVRFGNGSSDGDGVTIGGAEAQIISWTANRIVCRVPADMATTGQIELYVHTHEGNSNIVYFNLSPFRYRVTSAPAGNQVGSYLILCNYGEEVVHAKVYAGPSGAFVIEPQEEILNPWEVRYVNLKEYGLKGDANLLWVESDKDLAVSLIVADTALRGIYYIEGQAF